MNLIDVSVPLDAGTSIYPGYPGKPFTLGGGAIVIEGLNLRDVEPGVYEMRCLPMRVVGADGAPARALLRRS